MIRKFVGLALLFSLVTPIIALDRAPLICVMGGVATVGDIGHGVQHHMLHVAASAHDSKSHSTPHGKAHGCICPWECGRSRDPAVVVQASLPPMFVAEHGPYALVHDKRPGSATTAFFPLTTGPPRSLHR